MSVVNEINEQFRHLERDLETVRNKLDKLSSALYAKPVASFTPKAATEPSALLPSVSHRQRELGKMIGQLSVQIDVLHEVVNPSAKTPPTTSPFLPKPKVSEIEQRAVDALAIGLGYAPTKIGGQN